MTTARDRLYPVVHDPGYAADLNDYDAEVRALIADYDAQAAFTEAYRQRQIAHGRRARQAEADRNLLAQAMWDGLATLGFDTDGDETPSASLSRGYGAFAAWFAGEIAQERRDYDEACANEARAEADLAALQAGLTALCDGAEADRVRSLTRTNDGHPFPADVSVSTLRALLADTATEEAS